MVGCTVVLSIWAKLMFKSFALCAEYLPGSNASDCNKYTVLTFHLYAVAISLIYACYSVNANLGYLVSWNMESFHR